MKFDAYYLIRTLRFYRRRNLLILTILFLGALAIFVSSTILSTLETHLNNTSEMLGADIIIAPADVGEDIEAALFNGTPTTVTCDLHDVNDVLEGIEIEKAESELLISTIDADCCDSLLQVIAIDLNDDFAIHPWLKNGADSLESNEIIVGNDVSYNKGDVATFFGNNYIVADKLRKTEMGYDTSIFLNMDEGYSLLGENDIFSIILLKLKNTEDVSRVIRSINKKLNKSNLNAYRNDVQSFNINSRLRDIKKFVKCFNIIIIAIETLAMFSVCIFSIATRKKEINTFEVMGYSRNRWFKFFATEIIMMVFLAVVISVMIYVILVAFFGRAFSGGMIVGRAFLIPVMISFVETLLLFLIASLFSVFTSLFFYSRSNFSRQREGI